MLEQHQAIINQQAEEISVLKDEIKRLKKHKGKPRIKPSQMNKEKMDNDARVYLHQARKSQNLEYKLDKNHIF